MAPTRPLRVLLPSSPFRDVFYWISASALIQNYRDVNPEEYFLGESFNLEGLQIPKLGSLWYPSKKKKFP